MRIFVTEFADSKREIERHLNDVTEPIIEHLFKIYCFPNDINRHHWAMEIYSFLNKVKKLTGSNRLPTAKQIYNWTYFKWKDLITDEKFMSRWLKGTQKHYNEIPQELDVAVVCEQFDYICEQYFKWLAYELSNYSYVYSDDIEDKINELV